MQVERISDLAVAFADVLGHYFKLAPRRRLMVRYAELCKLLVAHSRNGVVSHRRLVRALQDLALVHQAFKAKPGKKMVLQISMGLRSILGWYREYRKGGRKRATLVKGASIAQKETLESVAEQILLVNKGDFEKKEAGGEGGEAKKEEGDEAKKEEGDEAKKEEGGGKRVRQSEVRKGIRTEAHAEVLHDVRQSEESEEGNVRIEALPDLRQSQVKKGGDVRTEALLGVRQSEVRKEGSVRKESLLDVKQSEVRKEGSVRKESLPDVRQSEVRKEALEDVRQSEVRKEGCVRTEALEDVSQSEVRKEVLPEVRQSEVRKEGSVRTEAFEDVRQSEVRKEGCVRTEALQAVRQSAASEGSVRTEALQDVRQSEASEVMKGFFGYAEALPAEEEAEEVKGCEGAEEISWWRQFSASSKPSMPSWPSLLDDVPEVSRWRQFILSSQPSMPKWPPLPEPLPPACHGIPNSIREVQKGQGTFVVRKRMRKKGPGNAQEAKKKKQGNEAKEGSEAKKEKKKQGIGAKSKQIGEERAKKMTRPCIYSRAYHKTYTKTSDKKQARADGNAAVEHWLAQG